MTGSMLRCDAKSYSKDDLAQVNHFWFMFTFHEPKVVHVCHFPDNLSRSIPDSEHATSGARKLIIGLESASSAGSSSSSAPSGATSVNPLHDQHHSQAVPATAGLCVDVRQLKAFKGVKLSYRVDWPLSIVVNQASFCCMLTLRCPAPCAAAVCGLYTLWTRLPAVLPNLLMSLTLWCRPWYCFGATCISA